MLITLSRVKRDPRPLQNQPFFGIIELYLVFTYLLEGRP